VVVASPSNLWLKGHIEVDVRDLVAFARRLSRPETAPGAADCMPWEAWPGR